MVIVIGTGPTANGRLSFSGSSNAVMSSSSEGSSVWNAAQVNSASPLRPFAWDSTSWASPSSKTMRASWSKLEMLPLAMNEMFIRLAFSSNSRRSDLGLSSNSTSKPFTSPRELELHVLLRRPVHQGCGRQVRLAVDRRRCELESGDLGAGDELGERQVGPADMLVPRERSVADDIGQRRIGGLDDDVAVGARDAGDCPRADPLEDRGLARLEAT